MKIAFLGIGLMGLPMVKNLATAGYELHLWNRSPEKVAALSDIATAHATPSDAVKNAEIVISMLADGSVTTDVIVKQGVVDAMQEKALLIDMGSVEPEVDLKIACESGQSQVNIGIVSNALQQKLSFFVKLVAQAVY